MSISECLDDKKIIKLNKTIDNVIEKLNDIHDFIGRETIYRILDDVVDELNGIKKDL